MISERIRTKKTCYICVANVRTTVLAQKDRVFCRIHNESFLTIPDGMPLVWAAWTAGKHRVNRVTGPDLMTRILEISEREKYSHYFYGDTEETLLKMIGIIRDRFQGITIVGFSSPPFRPLSEQEIDELIMEINQLRPTFLWIALGAPKQERLIYQIAERIESTVIIGVGAAFRFMIGEYKHPSKVIQNLGLEGVWWRFMKNPFREGMWYCYHIPAFFCLLAQVLINRFLNKDPWKTL